MNAEILSIGTELLLGEIVDTNSAHIARALRDIGVNLYYMATVGDNLERIQRHLENALQRCDLIITTGGLGPTVDDVTRQAVAAATHRELVFHQTLLDDIAEKFRRFGSRMSPNNRLQAYIPDGAIILENPVGTAPCYIVEDEKGIIISLPGVPREMQYLLEHSVLPYLRGKIGNKIIKALVLKTAGIGESHLDEQIDDLMKNANPTVGLSAHIGQTDIRITAKADSEAEADAMLQAMEQEVRARVGGYIYGTGQTPLQNALVDILHRLGKKLAIGDMAQNQSLIQRLQAVPGGTEVISMSETYPNLSALQAEMGEAGNIEALVRAKGQALLTQAPADIAIVIVSDVQAGTAMAVMTPDKTRSRMYTFGGPAHEAAYWSGTWGMSFAWRMLREMEESTQNG